MRPSRRVWALPNLGHNGPQKTIGSRPSIQTTGWNGRNGWNNKGGKHAAAVRRTPRPCGPWVRGRVEVVSIARAAAPTRPSGYRAPAVTRAQPSRQQGRQPGPARRRRRNCQRHDAPLWPCQTRTPLRVLRRSWCDREAGRQTTPAPVVSLLPRHHARHRLRPHHIGRAPPFVIGLVHAHQVMAGRQILGHVYCRRTECLRQTERLFSRRSTEGHRWLVSHVEHHSRKPPVTHTLLRGRNDGFRRRGRRLLQAQ